MDATVNNGDEKEVEIYQTMEKFGKYQIIQYLYTCLATLFVTIAQINYVFVAGELNYRCRIPECEGVNAPYNQTWWPTKAEDRCKRPLFERYVNESCTNHSFSIFSEKCTEWIYENNNTVIAELDLACQPWKSNLIGTIHSSGLLLGTVAAGWMADRFGRKPVLILCSVGCSIGHIKAFTSSYYVYIFIEFIEAVISGGTYTAVMVLMIEICGKKKRMLAGLIFAYGIYMGETVFAGIAMFVPYWKDLIKVIYSPPFVFISFIYLLNESPRWQILNERAKDAKKSLLRIATVNKININKEKLGNMNAKDLKKEFKMENQKEIESGKGTFKSKEINKRLFVAAFSRFTASFVYYGLMVNSVYLPGDKYVNFMLSSVMSYPGEIIAMYLMNTVGRRIPLICGYVVCGLVFIASGCIPEDLTWLKITFFLLGKMVISGCFTGVVVFSMELFPTQVRGTMIGICALTSSIGNILAPLTPILNTVSIVLPLIIFGSLAAISGVLLFYIPETKDLPLMDTIEQVENSVRNETKRRRKKMHGEDNEGFNKNVII